MKLDKETLISIEKHISALNLSIGLSYECRLDITTAIEKARKELEEPKTLLVTENNVEIKFGDELWFQDGLNEATKWMWSRSNNEKMFYKYINNGFKFFSTESSALEYIKKQKPKIRFTTECGYDVKEGDDIDCFV